LICISCIEAGKHLKPAGQRPSRTGRGYPWPYSFLTKNTYVATRWHCESSRDQQYIPWSRSFHVNCNLEKVSLKEFSPFCHLNSLNIHMLKRFIKKEFKTAAIKADSTNDIFGWVCFVKSSDCILTDCEGSVKSWFDPDDLVVDSWLCNLHQWDSMRVRLTSYQVSNKLALH